MKPREAAFSILYEVLYKNGYSNIAIEETFEKEKFDRIDAGFTNEIVMGTLRKKIYLEYVVMNFSKIKKNKISKSVMTVLLMSTYQILFMDRTPDSAACNEGVKIALKYSGRKVKAFVNAVLRNIVRNKENIEELFSNLKGVDFILKKYSCSRDVLEKLNSQYGEKKSIEILENLNKPAKTCVRLNKHIDENTIKKWSTSYEKGKIAESAYYLNLKQPVATLHFYKAGVFSIQDEGAQLMGLFTKAKKGQKVLDACASPGGKTLHLATMVGKEGEVVACEINEIRFKNMINNVERSHLKNIVCKQKDMIKNHSEFIEKFDVVLVDAPCSGLGTAKRRPEIKLKYKSDESITKKQYAILAACSAYVKKGGVLVYGTCTLFEEENEKIVEKFLSENDKFVLEDSRMLLPEENIGGFYMARMVKK